EDRHGARRLAGGAGRMSLALTITDNANGTGGLATIAGSDLGQTVTIYGSRLDSASLSWSVVGSRTGDGTVSLALALGYWWFYAAGIVASLPVATAPQKAAFTMATRSVLDRLLDAVVARVQTLTLPAIAPYTVALTPDRVQRFDEFSEMVLPLIQKPSIVVCTGKNLE